MSNAPNAPTTPKLPNFRLPEIQRPRPQTPHPRTANTAPRGATFFQAAKFQAAAPEIAPYPQKHRQHRARTAPTDTAAP